MNKEEAFFHPDIRKRSTKEWKGKEASQGELTQLELVKLYELADKQIKRFGDQIDGKEKGVNGEEILKLKQELSDFSPDEQKAIDKDFERLGQLSVKSNQLLEGLKEKIKKALAIAMLVSFFSMPAFASETQAGENVPQKKIERQLEKGKLEIRDLQPGMMVDKDKLQECLRSVSRSEPNEWRITVAWEKGRKFGQLLEVNEGGPTSSFSDANLALSSFIEGKQIEDIHTHPIDTLKKELKKTSGIEYDSSKFAAPPSFGDIASLYSSREFCKEKGLGMTALLNKKLFVEEPSGRWEYGIEDENNLRIKRFSDFVNSWRDKRNEMGRKMKITQEELTLINSFSEEINKNKDIQNEFTQVIMLFFHAKAKEVSDERTKELCLGIAKKAKQISDEACKDAFIESGVTQEDLDLITKVEGLTQEIYGFCNAEEASPKKKAQKINKLKDLYKKFGVFLKYEKNK